MKDVGKLGAAAAKAASDIKAKNYSAAMADLKIALADVESAVGDCCPKHDLVVAMPNVTQCLHDLKTVASDAEQALNDFKNKSEGQGIKEACAAVTEAKQAKADCLGKADPEKEVCS